MADVELVINIPEDIYKTLKTVTNIVYGFRSGKTFVHACLTAIRNGTPLPKGHGRLKDIDWIDDNCENHYSDTDGSWCYRWKDIENAPTIIEADKEEDQ